jgi:hypothetical protein
VNKSTQKKIEQAARLLDEVHQDLKDYMATLPAEARDDGRLDQQQYAIRAVYNAKQNMPMALSEIKGIVEEHGTPEQTLARRAQQ